MESFYNEMITSEISFLEEEIQRLEVEIELNSARHSTPLVVRHAGKQNLTQQTPRYITTTDQMTDHRVSPIEHSRHLAGQRNLTDNLGSCGGTANQCETRSGIAGRDVHNNQGSGNRYEPQGSVQSVETSSPDNKIRKTDQSRIGDQKHHFIKPATFDGSTGTSWSDFKSHFEVCAELNGWSPQEKGMYLAVSLRGNAQGVLGNLPGAAQRDYNALCIALEQRFAPTNQTELYRAQLRERKQKAVETLPELGQDIRRLTNLAYPTATVDLKEILAKEQFIDAIKDSDMRLRIKQARPTDLNDAVRHAVELQAFQSADKKMQESQGFVRTLENDGATVSKSKTDKVLKEITDVGITSKRSQIN